MKLNESDVFPSHLSGAFSLLAVHEFLLVSLAGLSPEDKAYTTRIIFFTWMSWHRFMLQG